MGGQSSRDNFQKLKYQYDSLLYFFKKHYCIIRYIALYSIILMEFIIKTPLFVLCHYHKAGPCARLLFYFIRKALKKNGHKTFA